MPPQGDAYLRVEDRPAPAGCLLELYVDDLGAAGREVAAGGAAIISTGPSSLEARSPAGLAFRLLPWSYGRTRPSPTDGSAGPALADQLCVDVPPAVFAAEVCWWSDLTSWPAATGALPEFAFLRRPPSMPLRLMFQRLADDRQERASAHLDFACSDRPAQVGRHLALGARHERRTAHWDTLRDSAGRVYCLTDRDPATGTLPLR